jgi:predicted DNA-binding protein
MHRTQIYLTDEQRERIGRMAEDRGVSRAEVIRGILDRELGIVVDATAWEEWLRGVRGRTADERLRDLGL